MDFDNARQRLCGCYVTVPTLFHDDAELSLNLEGIRRHVGFLLAGGLESGNAVFLAGGAAGDFSTMTFEERVAVAGTVVEAVAGRAPVAMGAQTTSTAELRRLGQGRPGPGRRLHPGLLPLLLSPFRRGFLRIRGRGGRSQRYRHHRLQHLLDQHRGLSGPGREAGRNTQRGGPQVGHAPPRLDDLRAGGASLRPAVFRDRQSDALRGQPHAGGPGLRGPRLQLLAGVGSPTDPATEPERLPARFRPC